jgi:hypothetical protein
LEENHVGVTSQERDRLAGHPSSEPPMDFRMSVFAFICLLLICIFILAASLIARSQSGKDQEEYKFLPAFAPARELSPNK